MRKFKPGEYVTPKEETDADRRLVYYARYYFDGIYGEFFRGKRVRMEPGTVGVVRAVAPSVRTAAPHEEFLVIDFCHPITGKVERAALHHSEVEEAAPPAYEIPRNGKPMPEEAFAFVR